MRYSTLLRQRMMRNKIRRFVLRETKIAEGEMYVKSETKKSGPKVRSKTILIQTFTIHNIRHIIKKYIRTLKNI